MAGRYGFEAHARLGRTLKGKWRLDELLGEGGAAAVYAATHRTGARVAIKLLHAKLCGDAESRSRFRREAYVANAVGHASVVAVMDDDVDDDGTPFLVMELLEGSSLEKLRHSALGSLDSAFVRDVALVVLDVLAAAHAQNIFHRDIKPSNLFLTRNGQVKVLDFGVAASSLAVEGASLHTRNDVLLGTPGFMAPEQARSRWDQVGARSDLWALGATMFTLLTGEPVHLAQTPSEQLGLAMTTSARSLGTVAPELPADLIAIVDRALAYDPEDRFPDAASMRAALAGSPAERGRESVTITPVTLTEITRDAPLLASAGHARRRWRWIAPVLAPLALLAAAGAVAVNVRPQHASPEPERRSPLAPLAPWPPTPYAEAPAVAPVSSAPAVAAPSVPRAPAVPPSPTVPESAKRRTFMGSSVVSGGTSRATRPPTPVDPWNQRL